MDTTAARHRFGVSETPFFLPNRISPNLSSDLNRTSANLSSCLPEPGTSRKFLSTQSALPTPLGSVQISWHSFCTFSLTVDDSLGLSNPNQPDSGPISNVHFESRVSDAWFQKNVRKMSKSTSSGGFDWFLVPKTPRSQILAPQGPGKGEEEHTHRHTVKAHVEKDRAGSRLGRGLRPVRKDTKNGWRLETKRSCQKRVAFVTNGFWGRHPLDSRYFYNRYNVTKTP